MKTSTQSSEIFDASSSRRLITTVSSNADLQTAISSYCNDETSAIATYGNIKDWDTSSVTSMSRLFADYCMSVTGVITYDLSNWDTSNVVDMSGMFADGYFNGDISGWDTSQVTDMSGMFNMNSEFNSDISAWNTAKVTDMSGMFASSYFNGDISGWDTSQVTDMSGMFSMASSFNSGISGWNTGSVTTMQSMFEMAAMFNQDLSAWNVANVGDMRMMFMSASSFNQALCWDLSHHNDDDYTFTSSGGAGSYYDGQTGETNQQDMFYMSSGSLASYPECSETSSPTGKPTNKPTSEPSISPYPTSLPSPAPTVRQEPGLPGDRAKFIFDAFDISGADACPNGCSGHGLCRNDAAHCECYRNANGDPAWTQNDCSLRTCPKGAAWYAVATAANEAHPPTECSNAGTCNRATGECECFYGTEGIACERTRCPNDCSGRGICYTQKQLAAEAGSTYTTPWDSMKITGCVCDIGSRGPDCSLFECPTGPDILQGDGNEKGRDCSGRGICDYSRGICKCFSGYYGTKCQHQTVLF